MVHGMKRLLGSRSLFAFLCAFEVACARRRMCTIRKLSQYRQRDFEGHGISCAFACWFRIVHRPRIPMVLLDASGVLLRRARHVLPPNCFFGFHDGQEQAANAGAQQWDYCVPKPNYAEVRARVGSAFAEKAHELADAVAVVQGLSKEATRLPGIVVAAFSCAVSFCGLYSLSSWQPWKPVQFAGSGNYIS
jgi:hypothetical protein